MDVVEQKRKEIYKVLIDKIRLFKKKNLADGCIKPVDPPAKGGGQHYWATIESEGKTRMIIRKQIGYKTSEDGEAHEVCFVSDEKHPSGAYVCENIYKMDIIAKLSPIDKIAMENRKIIKYQPWKEDFINWALMRLLQGSISPHFCYYYGGYVCKEASEYMFKNENIVRRFRNKRIMTDAHKEIVAIGKKVSQIDETRDNFEDVRRGLKTLEEILDKKRKPHYGHGVYTGLFERADKDLSNYLYYFTGEMSDALLKNISFQILQALYSMHECIETLHLDLHLYNVVVKYNTEQKHGVYRLYEIYGKKFYVPRLDVDIRLIDFGRSGILRFMKNEDIAQEAKENYEMFFGNTKSEKFYQRVLYNLSDDRKYYINCMKSFDVMRVFNELVFACKNIVSSAGMKFLESIVELSQRDFEIAFVSKKTKAGLSGTPQAIIQSHYVEQDIYNYNYSKDPDYIKEKSNNVFDNNNYVLNKQIKNKLKELINKSLTK